jgi:alpha-tubulin suppressor-like RCC1 family protein
MGVIIPYGKTPRETYIDRTIGGTLWVFGNNRAGNLGLNDTVNRIVPIVNPYIDNIIQTSCYTHSLCLNGKGHVYCFGSNQSGELGLGDNERRLIPILYP